MPPAAGMVSIQAQMMRSITERTAADHAAGVFGVGFDGQNVPAGLGVGEGGGEGVVLVDVVRDVQAGH